MKSLRDSRVADILEREVARKKRLIEKLYTREGSEAENIKSLKYRYPEAEYSKDLRGNLVYRGIKFNSYQSLEAYLWSEEVTQRALGNEEVRKIMTNLRREVINLRKIEDDRELYLFYCMNSPRNLIVSLNLVQYNEFEMLVGNLYQSVVLGEKNIGLVNILGLEVDSYLILRGDDLD